MELIFPNSQPRDITQTLINRSIGDMNRARTKQNELLKKRGQGKFVTCHKCKRKRPAEELKIIYGEYKTGINKGIKFNYYYCPECMPKKYIRRPKSETCRCKGCSEYFPRSIMIEVRSGDGIAYYCSECQTHRENWQNGIRPPRIKHERKK